jgi:NitT/TauT family transport system substrate-binding protein
VSFRRLLTPTAALLVLVLSACTGPAASPTGSPTTPAPASVAPESPPPVEPSPTEAAEPATVIVALNWPVPEYTHTGITMAEARGYYEEENIQVELQPLDGSSSAVQAVGAGSANIGFAGAGAILAGLAEDAPLRVVANHLQFTPTGVLYRPEHEVESFDDLAGLTIATQATGEDTVALFAFLRNAGLDPDTDVDIQVVDGAVKCTLMLAGTVDACTGFSTGHLVRAHAENPDIRFLPFRTEELQPIGHSIVVNESWLEGNEDVIRRFLRATYRGYREADANLQELAEIYIEKYPEEGLELYYESAVEAHELMRSPRTDEHGWGWMEDKPWADLQELLLDSETISSETPVSEIYTNEYLPEDAEF